MSLLINAENVSAVLLADGWHYVKPKTFSCDSFEIAEDGSDEPFMLHAGGRSGMCATGFTFIEAESEFSEPRTHNTVSGPLMSVLALRHS